MPNPPAPDFENELDQELDEEEIEDEDIVEALRDAPRGDDKLTLHEPVPAHVADALLDTDAHYPPPIDALLSWGDLRQKPDYPDALQALELNQSHVPHLIRMARDRALNHAATESSEVWAPTYALYALCQLDVSAAYADLVPLLDTDDEWKETPLTEIAKSIGEPVLTPLGDYLQDCTRWIYGRTTAADILATVAQTHTDLRAAVVQRVGAELEHATENDPTLNGFLVHTLVRLKATEALPVIRRAYELDRVEEFTAGPWDSILTDLGQPLDPDDPLLIRESLRRSQRGNWPSLGLPSKRPSKRQDPVRTPVTAAQQTKKKAKRKAAAASRKANRRK